MLLVGKLHVGFMSRMRTSGAAGFRTSAQRFVHDLADRQRATAALSAAPEATIHLTGRPRRPLRIAAGVADVMVGKNVAGTNDHGRWGSLAELALSIIGPITGGKRKSGLFK